MANRIETRTLDRSAVEQISGGPVAVLALRPGRAPRNPVSIAARACFATLGLLAACDPGTIGDPGEELDSVDELALTDGLEVWWPMSAGSAGTVADASGRGHTALLKNGARRTSAGVLRLDGLDDYLDGGSVEVSGTAITAAGWARSVSLANCPYRDCRILSKASGTADQDHDLMLSTVAAGQDTRLRVRLRAGGTTMTLIEDAGTLPQGAWFHAAATYDGATLRLYRNGRLVASRAKTGTLATRTGRRLWVGGNPLDARARPWKGDLDDIRIYRRALSGRELLALAATPPGGSEPSPADAGVSVDAGRTPIVDAGTLPRPDAGTSPLDSGTRPADGGSSKATLLFSSGFENGFEGFYIHDYGRSIVQTVSSPVAVGNKAASMDLRWAGVDGDNYRSELQVVGGAGSFDFNQEYWVSMKYRFEDWALDRSSESAPFQVHLRPGDWSEGCRLGSAWSNAPFLMATGNGLQSFVTYGGKVQWQAPVVTGRWSTVTVRFKISSTNAGFIEAWIDGNKVVSVFGVNTMAKDECGNAMRPPYWNMGIYKWDWRKGRVQTQSTRRWLLMDAFKIARGPDAYSLVTSN